MGQGRRTSGVPAAPLYVLCGGRGRKGKPCWAWVVRALWVQPRGGGGGDSCGRGSGPAEWELQDPGNRPLWAPACRLPVLAPRGTIGCLLGPGRSSGWEWGRGGWARRRGGWPGADLLDKASGGPAGQPLWGSHCTVSPLPQREGRGNWGSWQRRPGHSGLSFTSLCLPQSLCEHLLTSRHEGFLRPGKRPCAPARPPTHCPAEPRFQGGETQAFPSSRNHSF